jgi:hypothetical protein
VLHNRVESFNYAAALRKAMLSGRADVALGMRHPDRLALEFPRSVTFFPFIAAVCVIRAAIVHSSRPLLLSILWLAICWILELAGRMRRRRSGERWWTIALAQGLDWTFEAAKLFHALRRAQWRRVYLKFVYLSEQLVAERERRLAEAWVSVLALLAIEALWM